LPAETFAEQIGVTACELSAIEEGRVRATPVVVARCAELLNVSVETLFLQSRDDSATDA
jgi:transcriptional regulator with XRE-family HTH domain